MGELVLCLVLATPAAGGQGTLGKPMDPNERTT